MKKFIPLDVSNLGDSLPVEGWPNYRVFRSGRVVTYRNSKPYRFIGSKRGDGYIGIRFGGTPTKAEYARGIPSGYLLHRVVAQAFIPNPSGFSDVDHIDGNRANNSVENLRWVSREENMAAAFKRRGNWLLPFVTGNAAKKAVKIRRIDAITSEIIYYDSISEWAKNSGNPRRAANICKAIQTGRIAYGAYWSKASTPEEVAKASVEANTLPTSV